MVWIVGEYGHRIDNAVDLMLHFSESFNDESKDVQMAILTASVKLYLKLEDEAEDLVTKVLKMATDDSDNPDLRNRGYIYWRMLSQDPEAAKQIILCEKPPIKEDEGNLNPKLRDTLINNLSMLSSVYYKTPEQFVKKIRESLNERVDLENDGEAGEQDYIDSTGVKRSDYLKNAEPIQDDYQKYFEGKNQMDLLDMIDTNPKVGGGVDDLLSTIPSSSTSILDILSTEPSQKPMDVSSLLSSLDLGASPTLVPIPLKVVVQSSAAGAQKQAIGIEVEASVHRTS